jgi:hypothetical protein
MSQSVLGLFAVRFGLLRLVQRLFSCFRTRSFQWFNWAVLRACVCSFGLCLIPGLSGASCCTSGCNSFLNKKTWPNSLATPARNPSKCLRCRMQARGTTEGGWPASETATCVDWMRDQGEREMHRSSSYCLSSAMTVEPSDQLSTRDPRFDAAKKEALDASRVGPTRTLVLVVVLLCGLLLWSLSAADVSGTDSTGACSFKREIPTWVSIAVRTGDVVQITLHKSVQYFATPTWPSLK